MAQLKTIFVLTITLCILGCSSNESAQHLAWSELKESPKKQNLVIGRYITGAEQQLLSLELSGADHCINGQLTLAERYLHKAKQEYHSNLLKDAYLSLVTFDRQARKAQCILNYLEGEFGCQYTNKRAVIKDWYKQGKFEQCALNKQEDVSTKNKQQLFFETLHEFGDASIKPIYFESLNRIALILTTYPNSYAHIIGHADSIGSHEANKQLGRERASQVKSYLVNKGVSASNIYTKSKGESSIREAEHSAISRVYNRYTQIEVVLEEMSNEGVF